MAKVRIKLSSMNISELNDICRMIKDIASQAGITISGPIPLPTKKMKITTRKSPCGDGKASWDNYEMRVHKRLIDLGVNDRALRLIMRVPIPEGVQIQIEMLE